MSPKFKISYGLAILGSCFLLAVLLINLSLNSPGSSLSVVPKISSRSQLAQVADITNGLVGHWTFDEGSGATAADSSGNGNNGTLVNGPAWVAGKIGQALSFNGTNNLVSIPGSSIFDFQGDFTVSAWVKTTSSGAVVGRALNNQSVLWRIYNGFFEYQTSGANDFHAWPPANYQDGNWHMVTAVVSGTQAAFWVDGVSGTPVTISGIPALSGWPIYIGADRSDGLDAYAGTVDDVRVYNRALSASEIKQLYASGQNAVSSSPTQQPATTPVSSPAVTSTPSSPPAPAIQYTPNVPTDAVSTPQPQPISHNWFVNSRATGSNTGTDWNNAWKDGPDIQWSLIKPGDTIYWAGGAYGGNVRVGASGTAGNPIRILRVRSTDTAAVSAPGWDPSFDSQVVMSGGDWFYGFYWGDGDGIGSYVTIDGRVKDGMKIIVSNVANQSSGFLFYTSANDVMITNIEIAGPSGPNGFIFADGNNTEGIKATHGTYQNITISHNDIHGTCDLLYIGGASNVLIENNKLYDNVPRWPTDGTPIQHCNVFFSLYNNNVTFRYNEVWNWADEGILLTWNGVQSNFKIYGNLWHDSFGVNSGGTGRIIESQCAINGPIYFYNNTIVNAWMAVRAYGPSGLPSSYCGYGGWTADSVGENNVYSNVNFGTGLPNNDYDYNGGAGETHGIGGKAPFVSSSDFHLAPGSSPIGAGVNLGPEFASDLDGTTRPSSGPWDIGAYQYSTGGSLPPPSVVPSPAPASPPTVSSVSSSSITPI
ncbi:hypothetical protein KGQ27_02965, partial [Patescibacteria group bacterium]|nr:hypothetical protein [Patescibacteria group bacterium]MDE2011184.1 hypothetical protein [Patescibacteria group bacterium]MDE2233507.1 hypothetical protein [Patescibacteria group bacterium]